MRKKRLKKTLFGRILVRLTVPLFFLGAIFMGVQLANQIKAINTLHRVESRNIFDAAQIKLRSEVKKQDSIQNPERLNQKIKELSTFHGIPPIEIIDIIKRKRLFSSQSELSQEDLKNIENSLRAKKEGKPYAIIVDKNNNRLNAFIPLVGLEKNQIFIARVQYPLMNFNAVLHESRWTLIFILVLIALVGWLIGSGLSKSIVIPIKTLNFATREIMAGKLGKHVKIETNDEIQTLADTFNEMSDTLKQMKNQAKDSNPLTGLPGNQGIFEEVQKRIYEKQKFVMFHTDLDRFKVFNDHYGLAKGDEAIRKTADLLRAIREQRDKTDFIGHQGGDDFVVITRPQHAAELGQLICDQFDKQVVQALYPEEDLKNGYTLHFDRRGYTETGEKKTVKFPLLAISLAGVSNINKDFADHFQCMNAAVDVKKKVKEQLNSCYLIEE